MLLLVPLLLLLLLLLPTGVAWTGPDPRWSPIGATLSPYLRHADLLPDPRWSHIGATL